MSAVDLLLVLVLGPLGLIGLAGTAGYLLMVPRRLAHEEKMFELAERAKVNSQDIAERQMRMFEETPEQRALPSPTPDVRTEASPKAALEAYRAERPPVKPMIFDQRTGKVVEYEMPPKPGGEEWRPF